MSGIFKCLYFLGFIHLKEVLSAIKVDCFDWDHVCYKSKLC